MPANLPSVLTLALGREVSETEFHKKYWDEIIATSYSPARTRPQQSAALLSSKFPAGSGPNTTK